MGITGARARGAPERTQSERHQSGLSPEGALGEEDEGFAPQDSLLQRTGIFDPTRGVEALNEGAAKPA